LLRAGRAIFVTEMDLLPKWFSLNADLKTLLSLWEAHKIAGTANTNRCREIRSICLFALCLEKNTNERFLVGFRDYQRPGVAPTPSNVAELFIDGFAEIEDCDVILSPDYGPDGSPERPIQKYQIVGYRSRTPSTFDLIQFIERKKLSCTTPDDNLSLLINLELDQPLSVNLISVSIFLQRRQPKCPYSHVYLLGKTGGNGESDERIFLCWQLYPTLEEFPKLSLREAKARVFLNSFPVPSCRGTR
jgi:hypothetical protein